MNVLIENYNTQTGKYELGRQEFNDKDFESLKKILLNLKLEDSIPGFPVRLITENCRTKRINDPSNPKSSEKYCEISYLYKNIHIKKKIKVNDLSRSHYYELDFSDLTFTEKMRVIFNTSLIFLYTFILLFTYIFALIAYLRYMVQISLFFLVLWFWLVGLTISDFIYSILKLRGLKSYHKRLSYSIPLINKLKTRNLTKLYIRTTISYGALALLLLGFLLPDLRAEFEKMHILILVTLTFVLAFFVIVSTSSILNIYLLTRKKKSNLIHSLNTFLQENPIEINTELFYNKILLVLRNRSIVNIGFFSQCIAILTLLLSTIPLLTSIG